VLWEDDDLTCLCCGIAIHNERDCPELDQPIFGDIGMRIYVASSWRNEYQDIVVATLRAAHHEVYDFKHPKLGDEGFAWAKIDPAWKEWSFDAYRKALAHPIARAGFMLDRDAMSWAEACVLVLPCGRSAHLEAGWMIGQGKPVIVYIPEPEHVEPELMYLLGGDCLRSTLHGVLAALKVG
jgi:hypothetical protein